MLSRLLGRRNKKQNNFDYMVVEAYSFRGKAQDQFRRRKVVDAQMRHRNAVADVAETLLVTIGSILLRNCSGRLDIADRLQIVSIT